MIPVRVSEEAIQLPQSLPPPKNVWERLHRFYRGTLFNTLLIGLISFTQPGIWYALNIMGAGGQAEPYLVNAANVLTFGIMVFCTPISAVVMNMIGVKWVLAFGTLGFVPYSASLYCNSAFGTEWFLLFGAATCGFSASALWVAEASIGVGYPEEKNKGLYIGIWLCLTKLGMVIGSAVQYAMNAEQAIKGGISLNTYLALVGIQCIGLPLALLVSPPDKIIRTDGTKPIMAVRGDQGVLREVKSFFGIFKRKEIVILLPFFIAVQYPQTYQGNMMAAYFTVRSRGMTSLITAICTIIMTLLTGILLDVRFLRRSTRSRLSYSVIGISTFAIWICQLLVEHHFSAIKPTLDYGNASLKDYNIGLATFVFVRVISEVGSIWAYWILGCLDQDIGTLALTTGCLRGCESFGSAISFGIGASKGVSLWANCVVAAVLVIASIPASMWAAWQVKDEEVENGGVVLGKGSEQSSFTDLSEKA